MKADKLFWIIFLLALSSGAFACEGYRLTTLNNSKHYSGSPENEQHHGYGFECRTAENYLYSFGGYRNSDDNDGALLLFGREYPQAYNTSLGWVLGFGTGYDDTGIQKVLGVQARWAIFRFTITPAVAVSGLVVEF